MHTNNVISFRYLPHDHLFQHIPEHPATYFAGHAYTEAAVAFQEPSSGVQNDIGQRASQEPLKTNSPENVVRSALERLVFRSMALGLSYVSVPRTTHI